MSLSAVEVEITKTVVDRFLNLGESIPRKGLFLRAKSGEVLERLVRWSILHAPDQKNNLPLRFAFYCCGDPQTSLLAKQSTTVVCQVLKHLFENDQLEDRTFVSQDIEGQMQGMSTAFDPKQIRLGLYLGSQCGFFRSYSPNPKNTEITSFQINEHVIEINPDTFWDDYIEDQRRWIDAQATGAPGATTPTTTDDGSTRPYRRWEVLKLLSNSTGQAEVSLVRSPQRASGLANAAKQIQGYMRGLSVEQAPLLAAAILQSARADSAPELGALKVFKLRGNHSDAEQQMLDRFKSEIRVLKEQKPGLLRLLDSNEQERWIVTAYQPNGTLEDHLCRYKGTALGALKALRPLLETVADLHREGTVHRDIKPANIFVGQDHELILGDFGIAYLQGQAERLTRTNERVGPYDYMPPWADLGERLEKVEPNFDVYMLGKLLWCMAAGKLRLPREEFREPPFDLTQLFPDDPHMHIINAILDKSVVKEAKNCLPSAGELLSRVDLYLRLIERGGHLLGEKIPRPCRICGMGHYQLKRVHPGGPDVSLRMWHGGSDTTMLPIRMFMCDSCQHVEFFASN